jgi:hypothetical protein
MHRYEIAIFDTGRLGKALILDKKLKSLHNYLKESSGDDHIMLIILQVIESFMLFLYAFY